jgi:CDP-diacylglycerol--serine O-phosphatidyltransferase
MRMRRLSRRRRIPVRAVQVLPTLITAGNLLAGLLAISYLQDAAGATDPARAATLLVKAAWMIFLGMFCDGLDGRIARLTGTSSGFGAQLDSLADVVTFGVTPALLMKTLAVAEFPAVAPKLIVALAGVYVLGAALRLARYNTETARTDEVGEQHVTLVFRGLPSPAAAGVVASLVLLRHEYQLHGLDWGVLLATPLLGVLMVSRLPYSHLLNRWFDGARPFSTVVLLALVVFLAILYFHETVTAAFVLYGASGVLVYLCARATGWPRWAFHEEEDEEDLVPDAEAEAPADGSAAARGEPGLPSPPVRR